MTNNYFTDDELRCKGSSFLMLAPGFRGKLNELREAFGKPMVVNSCCRSYAHNAKVGGHPHSLHVCDDNGYHKTKGSCAIDIDTSSMSENDREKLIFLATANGWSVGLGGTFLHLDLRTAYTTLPQACFDY